MCDRRPRRQPWQRADGSSACRSTNPALTQSTRITLINWPRKERNMQREGSALHGLGVVFIKEMSDHLTSVRMRILEWLIILVGIVTVYFTIQEIKESTAEDPFLFLKLFSATQETRLSFAVFMTFLVPLVAIGLGFDSVNSEFNRRTLSRILAQPIYRDALLFGKFFAGLFTLSISLVALWLIVIGLGLLTLGVP